MFGGVYGTRTRHLCADNAASAPGQLLPLYLLYLMTYMNEMCKI